MEVRTDSRLNWHFNNGGRIVITLSKEIQQAAQAAKQNLMRLIDREKNRIRPVGGK